MTDDHPKLRPYTISGGDVLHVTFVMVAAGIVLIMGLTYLSLEFPSYDSALFEETGVFTNNVASVLEFVTIIFAVHYVLIRQRQMTWPEIGVTMAVPKVLTIGILGGVAIALPFFLVEQLLGPFEFDMAEELFGGVKPSILTLCATILLLGIVSAFSEELFFRGVIYSWMRSRWSAGISVPLNAGLFGLFHAFFYPPVYVIAIVFLGAVFALAYDKTGNIWLSVALHAGYNSTMAVMIYFSLT